MMYFKKHLLVIILTPLLLLFVLTSYYRFMVINDFMVTYEGDCDPSTESCFVGCEDDECTEEYYYSSIERYAPNLEELCGLDITECDDAYTCDGDESCTISFCNPATEEDCSSLTNEEI